MVRPEAVHEDEAEVGRDGGGGDAIPRIGKNRKPNSEAIAESFDVMRNVLFIL